MGLIIHGANVLTDEGLQLLDVSIGNGEVVAVGAGLSRGGHETIDASGKVLGPGFVDLHVHLREPGQTWKEDIESGTKAAAAGGFTAVVAMPNTYPAIDSKETFDRVSLAARQAQIDVIIAGALTENREGAAMSHLDDLYDRGVRIFTDDGDSVADAGVFRSVLRYLSDRPDVVVAQHSEDVSISADGHLHDGAIAWHLGIRGIPAAAEEVVIARDLVLAAETGVHYHAQHLSSAGSVQMIRDAKKRGMKVTAEVTPHHLLLTGSDMSGLDANFKMYPPLRGESDRHSLVRGLADGTIDVVATDHAPHSREEKDVTFETAPRGVIGLETAFSAVLEALDGDQVTLFDRMSISPAAIANMANQGNPVSVGAPANLVLVDPEQTWVPTEFVSRSANSPFLGRKLKGRVIATISRGEVVFGAYS